MPPIAFASIPLAVLANPRLTCGAKLLYASLRYLWFVEGIASPSNDQLASSIGGRHPRTISNLLSELQSFGLIKILRESPTSRTQIQLVEKPAGWEPKADAPRKPVSVPSETSFRGSTVPIVEPGAELNSIQNTNTPRESEILDPTGGEIDAMMAPSLAQHRPEAERPMIRHGVMSWATQATLGGRSNFDVMTSLRSAITSARHARMWVTFAQTNLEKIIPSKPIQPIEYFKPSGKWNPRPVQTLSLSQTQRKLG